MNEIRLIVGLGNPGREYEETRHNVGFMVMDRLAKLSALNWESQPRWECSVAKCSAHGVLLMKPLTFMNLSGRSVARVMRYHKWLPEQVMVVYDDVALDLGRLRIREKGSHGGHNGIRSLIEHFGTDVFPRIKLGIGSPGKDEMVGHVLGKFSEQEKETLQNMLATAANAVQDSLSRGISAAANLYNTTGKQSLNQSHEQEI
ncbi:MAG: aminoacyl-tRNA hydrolase [Akkermansiaceae bacterium]